mgnify:CR=1 FL=1
MEFKASRGEALDELLSQRQRALVTFGATITLHSVNFCAVGRQCILRQLNYGGTQLGGNSSIKLVSMQLNVFGVGQFGKSLRN